jgi:hypothetical protein
VSDDRIGEKLAMALGEALLRKGMLDADDLAAAAERSDDETVAHLLSCMVIQAAAPSQAAWEAERRRSQMRVIRSDDGGNKG